MDVYTFLPFMALIALFWFVLYKKAPETKGKSTLKITNMFKAIHSKLNLPAEERNQYQTFT